MSNPVAADRLREYCEKLCVALCVEQRDVLWALHIPQLASRSYVAAHRYVRNVAGDVCDHPFAVCATGHHLFDRVLQKLRWSKDNPLHLKAVAYAIARNARMTTEELHQAFRGSA